MNTLPRPLSNPKAPLLSVRNLSLSLMTGQGMALALQNVSFDVHEGEILGLVGESGSGKSLSLRSILSLLTMPHKRTGEILWRGKNIAAASEREMTTIRGHEIAMIFQEPMRALNPSMSVGAQIEESLKRHLKLGRADRRQRAVELLDRVGIPAASERLTDYPHQFSGGMRQRAMIAIALAANPNLLLADEPTTALDVTIQDQILRLLDDLCREMGMGIVLVTHDIGVVAQSCDRVAVMYGGRIIETGPVGGVLFDPRHRYTDGLLRSLPRPGQERLPLPAMPGRPPSLTQLPEGCAFSSRCAFSDARCLAARPALLTVSNDHHAACINPVKITPAFSKEHQ